MNSQLLVAAPNVESSTRLKRPVPRLALNGEEAAVALGVSDSSFRKIKNELPVVYMEGLRRFPVRGLEEWLAARERIGGRKPK